MPGIEDAHTHFFSRSFFEALTAASPGRGDPRQLLREIEMKAGIELPGDDVALRERWLAEMDAAGVDRVVSFASLPAEADAVAAAAAGSDGRIVGYTVVDPTAPDTEDFVARALGELGLRGLVLFPALHHVSPADPRLEPVYELAREHRAPVVVHCGVLKIKLRDLARLPRHYDLSFADPLAVVVAANRFPTVAFVLPHFGGGFFREALMAGDMCHNIHVDTSSSNDWVKTQAGVDGLAGVFRRALDVFGAGRILFGTDSSVFPRGWRTDVRDVQLTVLEAAGLGAGDIERIMGGNLRRLLGTGDSGSESAA